MQAIYKLWRSIGLGQLTEKSFKECLENLTEEMADVQIMLWQIEYLLSAENMIEEMIEKKLNRQLKRIEEE